MNSKLITVVLIVVFSCFAFAADKSSKRVYLSPGDNNVNQIDNGEVMPLPSNSVTQPSALYKVPPAHSLWLDHTDGGTEYYLSSGAAADTMAVWYKPAGACSLYAIETSWFDANDAATILYYIWEPSAVAPDPGLAGTRGSFGFESPLGDVVVGPFAFTPTTGDQYQGIELLDFLAEVPFFGDTEGTPEAFFVGFVKNDALPHILADDASARGYQYSWFGGPWTISAGGWGGYSSSIPLEFAMRIAVTYPFGASPSVGGISILPDTYDGLQNFEVSATVTDENTVTGVWLHWNINNPEPGVDSVAMTGVDDLYTATFNLSASAGDTVYYWVSGKDNDDNRTIENILSPNNFEVVAPENPSADILYVDDGAAIDNLFYTDILDDMGLTYEFWDRSAHRGIDASVTTGGSWTSAIVVGWGSTTVPTRTYESDHAWAAFLNAGGNLFYTDQDYFYTNGEVAEPTFVTGDFAFDFFGITGGSNDPDAGTLDTLIIGYSEDPITDFMSADLVPMRPDDWDAWGGANWTDFLEGSATPIVSDELGNDIGVRYGNGTFKTVLLAFMVEAMNDTTGWIPDSVETRTYAADYVTLLENAFTWLGFVTAIDDEVGGVPLKFSLEQNFPNPFNPTTEITFRLGKAVDVDLTIYSVTGQKVRTLVKGQQKAGEHTVTWNGMNDVGQRVATGVYFYTIEAGDFKAIKKMVLIK
jgi:hypothetical protein